MSKGWQTKTLGELSELITKGTTPTSVGHAFASEGINFVKVESITDNGSFIKSKMAHISPECHGFLKRSQLEVGDILFSIAGALGRTAFVADNILPANTNQALALIRLRPSKEVLPQFILKALATGIVLEQIEKFKGGVAQQNLSLSQIREFTISLPPLPEQQRIVRILDQAFAALAAAKANADTNRLNARALFDSHLESVFAQRGDGWVEKRLEQIVNTNCTLSYGIVQPGDEYPDGLPIVRPTDLTTQVITLSRLKRIDPKLANAYRRTTLHGGELLLCVRGSTGIASVASPKLAGANVTRGIVPILFDAVYLTQDFGYYLMTSGTVQSQIREKTYGTALMQINIGDLRKVMVSLPTIDEQQRIVAQLDALREQTQRLESLYRQKGAALDELKKALLHQAFAGEL